MTKLRAPLWYNYNLIRRSGAWISNNAGVSYLFNCTLILVEDRGFQTGVLCVRSVDIVDTKFCMVECVLGQESGEDTFL